MSVHPAKRASRRRLAAGAFVLPVAAAAVLVGSVATAPQANAGRIQVSDTTLTSTSQSVTISVKLGALEKGKLGLTPPGGTKPVQVASGTGPKKLSYTMSLSCPTYAGSCVEDGRRAPAANGTWRVTFDNRVLVLGSGEDTSFVVAAPPAKPRGVTASAPSAKRVAVRWSKGAEPDLSGYRISVGGRNERVPARSCNGSKCTAKLAAPSGGGNTPVRVVALRDSNNGKLRSGAATTSVTVPEAEKPAARSAGSGGGVGKPSGRAGGGSGGGFPSTGAGKRGWPGGDMPVGSVPSSDPYPSFGARPKVAPVETSNPPRRRAVEPLAYGQARGDVASPLAIGMVLALVASHVCVWRRGRRLRLASASAGAHRASRRRRTSR